MVFLDYTDYTYCNDGLLSLLPLLLSIYCYYYHIIVIIIIIAMLIYQMAFFSRLGLALCPDTWTISEISESGMERWNGLGWNLVTIYIPCLNGN